jgi:hypothetical protein
MKMIIVMIDSDDDAEDTVLVSGSCDKSGIVDIVVE